jgi:hypothetical protein
MTKKYKLLDLDKLRMKKSTIVSSEEALKDVIPFLNKEEIDKLWNYDCIWDMYFYEHDDVVIDRDKSKKFLDDSKKNVVKPEFLDRCLRYSRLFKGYRCDNFEPMSDKKEFWEKNIIENCGNCGNWCSDEGKCKVLGNRK